MPIAYTRPHLLTNLEPYITIARLILQAWLLFRLYYWPAISLLWPGSTGYAGFIV